MLNSGRSLKYIVERLSNEDPGALQDRLNELYENGYKLRWRDTTGEAAGVAVYMFEWTGRTEDIRGDLYDRTPSRGDLARIT
jgi:hypothetical protein